MDRDEQLAQRFAQFALALHTAGTPAATQCRVTRGVLEAVPACDHAAMSLITRHGTMVSAGSTDETAARVDQIQYEQRQGPCFAAIGTRSGCRIDDLCTDMSAPEFSKRVVAQTGVRSAVAVPLVLGDDVLGALSLYASRPGAFDRRDVATAGVLATHAAIAIAAARCRERCAELAEAVASNREIGTAIGILMAGRRITSGQALDLLRQASRRSNRKLRDIATDVTETGEIPSAPR